MREILFRGKRVNNGEWVFGYYAKYRNIRNEVYAAILQYDKDEGDVYSDGIVEVIPETVGEYTGLTDENGKKIFEGDIIAIDEDSIYYHTASGPVRTYKGMWVSFYLPDAHGRDCYDELYRINAEREVIGNIHDNPELLQEDMK